MYCLIDKGRVMRSPFEELTLLDYAINASLVLSNIALLRQDRAGIPTFANEVSQVLPAERKHSQLQRILELFYRQRTQFLKLIMSRLRPLSVPKSGNEAYCYCLLILIRPMP